MKKLLFVVSLVVLASPKVFGLAELTQDLITSIPSSINLTSVGQDKASGEINPDSGILSHSLSASFILATNGSDANYDYVLTSSVQCFDGGLTSAYFKNNSQEYIALANNSNKPTNESINNIKSLSPSKNENKDVIAYPVYNNIQNLENIVYLNNEEYGGAYYKINIGDNQNGTITQYLGVSPLSNTYSHFDSAGDYRAVITLSAIRKP